MKLPRADRLMLQAKSGISSGTMDRYESGMPIRPISLERLQEAAKALGITLPSNEVVARAS